MRQRPPIFPSHLFPDDESDIVNLIQGQLVALGSLRDNFRDALALHDHCLGPIAQLNELACQTNGKEMLRHIDALHVWKYWRTLAFRDGARVLYLVSAIFEDLTKVISLTTVFNDRVLHKTKRAASSRLRQAFPGIEHLRHAGAHTHELVSTLADLKKHSVVGPRDDGQIKVTTGASLYIGERINGRRYGTTAVGQEFSYELSSQSLSQIEEVIQEYWQAFRPAEELGDHLQQPVRPSRPKPD